ncbi:Kinetochore-associated protein MTW1 [Spathaspora sp. JA1]|nr:Kinetochore-associated protein MTW1 [Spathaspora sp. JA1]
MSDYSLDSRNIALLTEHFGFVPIELIDEVINAANELMYRGTKSFQEYLEQRRSRALQQQAEGIVEDDNDHVFARVSDHEIENGMAKLESLLESQIDINFDKYELYTLRNIFHIPSDLVVEGWIKLKHHEGIEFRKDASIEKQKLDEKVLEIKRDIQFELYLRRVLRLHLVRLKKLVKLQKAIAENIRFLSITKFDKDSEEVIKAKGILKSLSPLDQTLLFLIKQTKKSVIQLDKLATKINLDLQTKKFGPNDNDKFIDGRTVRILTKTGVVSSDSSNLSLEGGFDTTMETNTERQSPELDINFSLPSSPELETVHNLVEATTSQESLE